MALYTEQELRDLIDQAQLMVDQITVINGQMLDHIHNEDGSVTDVSDIRADIANLQNQVSNNAIAVEENLRSPITISDAPPDRAPLDGEEWIVVEGA